MSEHVYRVAVALKMTERAEQQICNQFCIMHEQSSAETIHMIQEATQIRATDDWQLHQTMDPLMPHVLCRVFGETSNHPGGSAPTTAQIWCPVTFGFFQNFFTFEREEISDC